MKSPRQEDRVPNSQVYHKPGGIASVSHCNSLVKVGINSLISQLVKNLPVMQETLVDPWVRKVPWRRERLPTLVFWPGEFHGQSMGSQRVRHDWVTFIHTHIHTQKNSEIAKRFWFSVRLEQWVVITWRVVLRKTVSPYLGSAGKCTHDELAISSMCSHVFEMWSGLMGVAMR